MALRFSETPSSKRTLKATVLEPKEAVDKEGDQLPPFAGGRPGFYTEPLLLVTGQGVPPGEAGQSFGFSPFSAGKKGPKRSRCRAGQPR